MTQVPTKDYRDLVAEFLAKKAPTVIPTGERTMGNAQMKKAVGYEPDVVRTVEPERKIYEVIDHAGRSFFHNEQGEWL